MLQIQKGVSYYMVYLFEFLIDVHIQKVRKLKLYNFINYHKVNPYEATIQVKEDNEKHPEYSPVSLPKGGTISTPNTEELFSQV